MLAQHLEIDAVERLALGDRAIGEVGVAGEVDLVDLVRMEAAAEEILGYEAERPLPDQDTPQRRILGLELVDG